MKSVTEFPTHKLDKGIEMKTALTTEGKSPEEMEAAIGEAMKLEGDKLKYFVAALDVAAENREKLTRIRVMSPEEGEKLPEKAVQVEEHVYLPEFAKGVLTADPKAPVKKNDTRGKGKRKDGPKSSPWGITPEEAAAKKAASKEKAKAAEAAK